MMVNSLLLVGNILGWFIIMMGLVGFVMVIGPWLKQNWLRVLGWLVLLLILAGSGFTGILALRVRNDAVQKQQAIEQQAKASNHNFATMNKRMEEEKKADETSEKKLIALTKKFDDYMKKVEEEKKADDGKRK